MFGSYRKNYAGKKRGIPYDITVTIASRSDLKLSILFIEELRFLGEASFASLHHIGLAQSGRPLSEVSRRSNSAHKSICSARKEERAAEYRRACDNELATEQTNRFLSNPRI